MRIAVALGLFAVLLGHCNSAPSARLNDKLTAAIIKAANLEFDKPNLFGIYRVKDVKVERGRSGTTTTFVELQLKETLCPLASGMNPLTCDFNPAASPALRECKAIVTETNTNAPVVSTLSCDEESDGDSREFVNRRMKRAEHPTNNRKPPRRPGTSHLAARPGKPDLATRVKSL